MTIPEDVKQKIEKAIKVYTVGDHVSAELAENILLYGYSLSIEQLQQLSENNQKAYDKLWNEKEDLKAALEHLSTKIYSDEERLFTLKEALDIWDESRGSSQGRKKVNNEK